MSIALPARPENVLIVRQAIAGAAQSYGSSEALIADVKLAVTEACTNAVKHAYDGTPGDLQVELWSEGGELVVEVRDFGAGFDGEGPIENDEGGLGLGLIDAVAKRLEISRRDPGTEVRFIFAIDDGQQE